MKKPIIEHPDAVKEKIADWLKKHKLLAWVVTVLIAASSAIGVLANIFGVFNLPTSKPATSERNVESYSMYARLDQLSLNRTKAWVLEYYGIPAMEDSWLDDKDYLNPDLYEEQVLYEDLLYVSNDKGLVLRIFLSEEKIIAFFVTITNEIAMERIYIPSAYSGFSKNLIGRPLGYFTYYETGESNAQGLSVETSFSSNTSTYLEIGGVGRPFYLDTSFWNLQYGLKLNMNNDTSAFWADDQINGSLRPVHIDPDDRDSVAYGGGDRKINRPNTFGFSYEITTEMYDRLTWRGIGEIYALTR